MGKLWEIFSDWIFWFGLFSIVILGTISYFVLGDDVESTVTQQLVSKQQVITRAETSNIITYLQSFGNSVAVLAQLSSVKRHGVDASLDLDVFVEQKRANGIIGGVVLTDRNGVVQLNSNILGTRDTGSSLEDRDFFEWAKTQGRKKKYFISKPVVSRLGGSKGQAIIVVASPVYQGNVFTGVVAASLKLQPLVDRFFGLMKVSDLTEIYVVDGMGELLYSNAFPDAIGSNISELFLGDQAMSDSIKNVLLATKEGQFQTEKQLFTYSPIQIGTQNWFLIISSPTQEVINLSRPYYVHQAALLLVIAFTVLIFGVLAIREKNV